MELRSVLLSPGVYNLQGYYDTGTQAQHFFGVIGALGMCAAQAAILVANSNSGMTYDSGNHDPFE